MITWIHKWIVKVGLLCALVVSPAQAVTPDELFEVLQRLEALENEVRFLRGENEQLRFDLDDMRSTQRSTAIRIDDRIEEMYQALGRATRKMSAPVAPAKPAQPLKMVAPKKPAPAAVKPVALKRPTPAKPVPVAKPKPVVKQVVAQPKPAVKPVKPMVTKTTVAKAPVKKPVVRSVAAIKPTPVKLQPTRAPSTQEKREYNLAYSNIQAQPSLAVKGFKTYLKRHPRSPLAPNAHYWLGGIMYSRRNYTAAINEFIRVLQSFRTSNKAPDAAIKLGYSFYELKNWAYARRTLEDILRYYPTSNAAKLAQTRLNKMRERNLF